MGRDDDAQGQSGGAPGSGKGERTQELPVDPMQPCVPRSPSPGTPSLLAQ